MNCQPPNLYEHRDFRRMSVAESGGVYRFKLLRPAVYFLRNPIVMPPRRIVFCAAGVEWLRIESHRVTVAAGYAWNGNSVKKGIRIFGRDVWLGTPDHDPGTISASLIHDALFQFSGLDGMPFSLEVANDIYEDCCRYNKFALTGIYRSALDEASSAFWGKYAPNQSFYEA